MTPATGPDPADPHEARLRRDADFVERLLGLRGDVQARAALVRGATPALAHRAIPHLGNHRVPEVPVETSLMFASLLMSSHTVPHAPRQRLGSAAWHSLTSRDRRNPGASRQGRDLVAVQRQQLTSAHRVIASLCRRVSERPGLGLDWIDMWSTYRMWDHPDPFLRARVHRRLLLDFHTTTSDDTTAQPSTSDSDQDDASDPR